MPQRRANDAQVERLLHALKTDLSYRQDLARRISKRDKITYKSAMRRLQRYITEGEQKRSFVRAPVEYKRELRQEFRAVEHERKVADRRRDAQEKIFKREEREDRVRERESFYRGQRLVEDLDEEDEFESRDVSLNDLRALVAYHDGGVEETAEKLSLSDRGERLLDLAVTGEGVDVLGMRGAGSLVDSVRDFFNDAEPTTKQEIQDFSDLLYNLPDWQIGMIIEDMRNGNTTFAEWLDAWYSTGMDLDTEDSEYWRVWRAAYARAKK